MKYSTFNYKALLAIIVGIMLGAFQASTFAAEAGIVTGGTQGTYYAFGNDIKRTCSGLQQFNVLESAGSLSNIERVLGNPDSQYGIVQQDALLYKTMDGTQPDAKKTKEKLKMIFPLYNEEIHVLVPANSPLNSLQALAGKKVVVGVNGSGNWVTAQIMQAKTEIAWLPVEIAPQEAVKQPGAFDAIIAVGGKPLSYLRNDPNWKLISISHPALEGFYSNTSIPEGTYAGSKTRVNTYGVKSILVTFDYKNQFQQEIAQLTQCIATKLAGGGGTGTHAKWREVDPSTYTEVKWPVSPIALRYLTKQAK